MGDRRLVGWLTAAVVAATVLVAQPGGAAGATADMNGPRTLAVDEGGRVFVTDTDNHRILRIDPSGAVITVAGTGEAGYGGDGGPATAARLWRPHGIAVDGAGNVYVADSPNHRIRRIDPVGIITTVAGTGRAGYGGDGGPATAADLDRPRNLVVDAAGNLIIADTGNYRVRRVDRNGIITTIAGTGARATSGDGGPATAATFEDPRDVALDAAGNLYVVDTEAHRVRRIDRSGTVTTVAGTGRPGFSGDGGPATVAQLREPRGVALDRAGKLFIADSSNDRARWVDGSGIIHTLAERSGSEALRDPRGLNTDGAGRVYIADTGNDRIIRVDR